MKDIKNVLDEVEQLTVLTVEKGLNTIDRKNTFINLYKEKKHKILKQALLHLPQDDQKVFDSKINIIVTALEEKKQLTTFNHNLDEVLSQINEIKNELSISQIRNRYLADKSVEALDKLLTVVGNNGSPKDYFAILLLFIENGIEVQRIDDKIIWKAIELFYKKYDTRIFSVLSTNIDIVNQYSKLNKDNIINVLFLAIILYRLKYTEVAMSLIESNYYKEETILLIENYPAIDKLVQWIIQKQEYEILESNRELVNPYLNPLKNIFDATIQRHIHTEDRTNNFDLRYKDLYYKNLLPSLKDFYRIVINSTAETVEEIIFELAQLKSTNIYEVALKKEGSRIISNHNFERVVISLVDEILRLFDKYLKWNQAYLKKNIKPSILLSSIEIDVNKMVLNAQIGADFAGSILNLIKRDDVEILNLAANDLVCEQILTSEYLLRIATNLAITIYNYDYNNNIIYEHLMDSIHDELPIEKAIQVLLENEVIISVKSLAPIGHNYEIKCSESENLSKSKIVEYKEQYKVNNMLLPSGLGKYIDQGRYGLAISQLQDKNKLYDEDKKRKTTDLVNELKILTKKALELKSRIIDHDRSLTSEKMATINNALDIVEEISRNRLIEKRLIGVSIIDEVERLIRQPNESTEELVIILERYNEPSQSVDKVEMTIQSIPITTLAKYVEDKKYRDLQLTKSDWDALSSDRREDFKELLLNFELMKTKSTVYADVMSDNHHSTTEQQLQDIATRLSKICSLYRTNDDQQLGQEPFAEWRSGDHQLPFIFCTKIQSPRCEALSNVIRIYFLSEKSLKKSTFTYIRDHIDTNKYHSNGSASMILLFGDRKKYDEIKKPQSIIDIPVIDENGIKRILFGKKSPKWEFVSFLTLDTKISIIQPFKTQGSVSSDMAIFVGRKDIIKEMTTAPKNFAIYGGRRIGKSSLLTEVKRHLEGKGFATSYQSFQGYEDILSFAKGILQDLSRELKGQTYSNSQIKSLDDFSLALQNLYLNNKNRNVVIFLDEVDELILKEKGKSGQHKIIEIFRDLYTKSKQSWRFIFAGYKEMYLEIHGKGSYQRTRNPWENFIQENNCLSELESPRELIDEGLKNILGLEYDREVSKLIEDYSSGHPAFIQMFCYCLTRSIDPRISSNSRQIFIDDVKRVFDHDREYLEYVKSTMELNLVEEQRAIVYVAALEGLEVFDLDIIWKQVSNYCQTKVDKNIVADNLELLQITGVIKRQGSNNEYKFSHPHYINILNQFEKIDQQVVYKVLENAFHQP